MGYSPRQLGLALVEFRMPLGAAGAVRGMNETLLEPIATWACCRQRDWICPGAARSLFFFVLPAASVDI